MFNTPKITVVIPLYNKEKYIGDCLESVIRQSEDRFEVIIVDDGSTDDSLKQVRKFSDPRIKILSQVNGGPGIARNLGIENAAGEYIAFIDADDVWSPKHLEEIMAMWCAYPEAGAVSTTMQKIDSFPLSFARPIKHRNFQVVDYFREAAVRTSIVHTSAASIRRDVVEKIGGFKNRRHGEDLELWARIALNYKIVVSRNVTVGYRRVASGLSQTARLTNIKRNNVAPKNLSISSPAMATLVEFLNQDEGSFEGKERTELKQKIHVFLYARFRRKLYSYVLNGNLEGASFILETSKELKVGKFSIITTLIEYRRMKVLRIYVRAERFVWVRWHYFVARLRDVKVASART